MWEAKVSESWDHTSSIVAVIANANRKKGKAPIKPNEIHPFKGGGKKGVRITRDNIHLLKALVPGHAAKNPNSGPRDEPASRRSTTH